MGYNQIQMDPQDMEKPSFLGISIGALGAPVVRRNSDYSPPSFPARLKE